MLSYALLFWSLQFHTSQINSALTQIEWLVAGVNFLHLLLTHASFPSNPNSPISFLTPSILLICWRPPLLPITVVFLAPSLVLYRPPPSLPLPPQLLPPFDRNKHVFYASHSKLYRDLGGSVTGEVDRTYAHDCTYEDFLVQNAREDTSSSGTCL